MMSKKKNRNRSAQSRRDRNVPGSGREQAQQYARRLCRVLKEMKLSSMDREGMDADALRLKRRIEAAVNTAEDFRMVLEAHGFETGDDDTDFWYRLNLEMTAGPDWSEQSCRSTLAAAIWMLDMLTVCGRFAEACSYFPSREVLDAEGEDLPEIRDLCHDAYAIRAMEWIIRHRNDDCTGMAPNGSALVRTYMDAGTVAGTQHQDVPSRRRFEMILGMIPRKRIEEAVQGWMAACHGIMVRFKRSHDIYEEERRQIYRKAQALNESAHDMLAEALRTSQEAECELSALMGGQNVSSQIVPGTNLGRYSGLVKSRSLYDLSNSVEREMRQVDAAESFLIGGIGLMRTMSEKQRDAEFGAEFVGLWEDFAVHAPYDMCFAYLFLLDRGDDLIWDYGISGTLLECSRNALPWCLGEGREEDEDMEVSGDNGAAEQSVFSIYGTFCQDRLADADDCRQRYNLAQIVYWDTGYILPRTVCGYSDTQAWLDRFGLLNSRIGGTALNTITLLRALSERSTMPDVTREQMEGENTESLQRRIRELEVEKKRLRQERHEADRAVQALCEKLDAMEAAAANDRRELAELRELLFCRDCPEEDAAAEIKAIGFPVHTERNILVYGGHDSWLREIRKKLPDVRFIQKESKVDPQLVRNADEIWFQTNSLSHKLYDAVTQHASRNQVPVRYFHFASAAKCAEELVLAQRT